jgi:cytochrome c oxidase cbb3-type subunit 3
MLLPMRKQLKYGALTCTAFLLMTVQSLHAAGPPAPSAFENPVTIGFVILMMILLLVIAMLANLLLGVAQVKMEKEKKEAAAVKAATVATMFFLLLSSPLLAQDKATETAGVAASTAIAGMPALSFYIMTAVVFVELIVILVLLMNVRILLKAEKEKEEGVPAVAAAKQKLANLWMRINSFRPAEQEADIDLGHDYDGIRELDNRLPPWWLYGFYLTIIVAGIYLYRFHVAHTGPGSGEEYATAVANADQEVKEYLKKKGDLVDENTVTLLTSESDLAEGKTIFMKSCVACHKEDGRGDVGPNLTDNYWIHGADVKSVFKTIRYGINAIPKWETSYSNKEIAALASYVKSLKGTKPTNAKAPQGVLVTEDTIPAQPAADSAAVKVSSVSGVK